MLGIYNGILLINAAGSGKTSFILNYALELNSSCFIFLSPLKAIVEEIYLRLKNDPRFSLMRVEIIRNQRLKKQIVNNLTNYDFILSTTNQFSFEDLTNISERYSNLVMILDEVHLCFYWGDTFREDLWENYYGTLLGGHLFFWLTATIENTYIEQMKKQCEVLGQKVLVLNYGNQKIHNEKMKFFYFPSWIWPMMNYFIYILAIFTEQKLLIFVSFRQQVDEYLLFFKKWGVSALGAKGGKVMDFCHELSNYQQLNQNPQIIVSTSCLSHGVNLPSCQWLFITYPVSDWDFFIQIAARAGRKGEKVYIFHQNKMKK